MYILTQFLGNNEECATCKARGIMRSVYPINFPGECIMKVEVFVHWQECVNHIYVYIYTQALAWE